MDMSARASLRRLNCAELAELTGLSNGTVSAKLNRAGLEPAEVRGRVKVFDSPRALAVLLGASELDPRTERARLDAERADAQALANRVRRGELLEAADVEAAGAAVMSGVTQRFSSLHGVAPELRAASSDAEAAEILAAAVREALSEIARMGEIVDDARRGCAVEPKESRRSPATVESP
jgi:hypothetical protein